MSFASVKAESLKTLLVSGVILVLLSAVSGFLLIVEAGAHASGAGPASDTRFLDTTCTVAFYGSAIVLGLAALLTMAAWIEAKVTRR